MNEITRWECTPQQYIRELFADTKDGKLSIMIYPKSNLPYEITYSMDWKESDVEFLIGEYEKLSEMLRKFGKLHKELKNTGNLDKLLTLEEREVWDTYILPYEPFEVEEHVINELYFRGEYDQLDDEENALLERHYVWKEEQSQKRLPYKRCSPTDMIEAARWYEFYVQANAESSSLHEAGRVLAREMLIYYYCV